MRITIILFIICCLTMLGRKISTPKQKYLEVYSKYDHISKSSRSDYHAYCGLCRSHFQVKNSGVFDIKRHIQGSQHQSLVTDLKSNKSITDFRGVDPAKNALRAECFITLMIVEHNLPIMLADHISPLVRNIFPNDAKHYKCKKTKTKYIVTELAKMSKEILIENVKESGFCSISTDGSADQGFRKQLYPLLIRYYNKNLGVICTEVLSIPDSTGDSTGENIFKLLDCDVKKYGLSWKNIMSFASDNAAVMMGRNKGVAGHILRECDTVIMSGCTCHLAAIAASKAAKKMPICIEDVLLDIFYHMKSSSKRTRELMEIQESIGMDVQRILNYCPTRWLSMGKCLPRLLKNWTALVVFFGNHLKIDTPASEPPAKKARIDPVSLGVDNKNNKSREHSSSSDRHRSSSEKSSSGKASSKKTSSSHRSSSHASKDSKKKDDSKAKKRDKEQKDEQKTPKQNFSATGRPDRIYKHMTNPMTKLTCLFLNSNIQLFDEFNLLLQNDEPMIHKLRTSCFNLLTDLYVRFVKSSAMKNANGDMFSVKYSESDSQKSDENLVIGVEAQSYMDGEGITESQRKQFLESVRKYYVQACDYILQKFPLKDETLIHAEVADISKRASASFQSVMYFVHKHPNLVGSNDNLQQQFLRYQVDNLGLDSGIRIDGSWHNLCSKYPDLSKVMLAILCIPHSNADSERVFSACRRIQTEFRSSMHLSLLESLIVVKRHLIARNESCFDNSMITDSFLARAKSCTYLGLKAAQDKEDPELEDPLLHDVTGKVLRILAGYDSK